MSDYMTKAQSVWYVVLELIGLAAFVLWVFVPGDQLSLPILGILFYGFAQDIRIHALTRALNNTERLANEALTKAHR